MAKGFKVVNLDPPITQTINGQTIVYALEYDLENEKVRVIETGTNKANPDVIYTDGDWTKDSNLLNLSNSDKLSFHTDIQIAIKQDYDARVTQRTGQGGIKKPKLPAWAKSDRVGLYASQPAGPPISSNGEPITYNNPTGLAKIGLFQKVGALIDPMGAIMRNDVTQYVTLNERNARTTPMMYPMDMSPHQDKMVIQCYTYQPPSRDGFLSTSKNSRKTRETLLTKGLSRSTPLKYKVGGGIILPMPNTVKDASSVSWETDKLNNLAAAAAGLVSQNFAAKGIAQVFGLGGMDKLLTQLKLLSESGTGGGQSAMSASLMSGMLNKLGYDVSPETILARGAGIVPNSNMELMFRGPQMRQFNYTYQLTARDPDEASEIRQIIRHFKEMSSAKKNVSDTAGVSAAGDPSFFLGTPNIWTIRYCTANFRDIPGVNIIKPCALTRFETDYAPHGSWQAFDKGQPVSYKIQMDFAELEPVYNTDYNNRVGSDRVAEFNDAGQQINKGDLRRIDRKDMIGY